MKVMSIKTPHCFSEDHGWIPVMQTNQLLGCPTCYKATKLPSMYNHSHMCGVKCLQDPQLMEKLEKTRQIKKAASTTDVHFLLVHRSVSDAKMEETHIHVGTPAEFAGSRTNVQ
jgi:hypothetical protein